MEQIGEVIKKNGGKRPNAGRKPGKKTAKTLEREKVAEAIRQQIMKKADVLIRAAMIPAMGTNFIYRIDQKRNKKGEVTFEKHVLVTDAYEIEQALDQIAEGGTHEDGNYYYVSAEKPDFRAVQMLLDRSLGKSKETVELTNPDGNLKTIIINKSVKK